MINFYSFSWGLRIFITILLGFCVLFQTLAIVTNFYRSKINTKLAFKNMLEVSILFEILIFSLMHGQIVNAYRNGIVVTTGYYNIRIFIFLITVILIIFDISISKKSWALIIVPWILISLPLIEDLLGTTYPWFFLGTLVFFLIRSINICISSIDAIRKNISALSVKHAIDTLETGILFSESDGHTILSNKQMQNLMIATTGKVYRNSKAFYEILVSDEYKLKYEKAELDGQLVYLLQDGSALMFTKTEVFLRKKRYIHISFTDVTELWSLTCKLEIQNQELKDKSNKLKETIENLQVLSEKTELERAKLRAHDVLGQRLSVLLRMIENENNMDYELMKSLSKGLLTELKAEKNERGPYDEMKNIQGIFSAIGVDIIFEGDFPENHQQRNLFIDIIREGSTNAVRHGFATKINIKAGAIEDGYSLTIKNNGYVSSDPIIPGSGISVMRKKASDLGGNLEIIKYPSFTLSLVLPGGE